LTAVTTGAAPGKDESLTHLDVIAAQMIAALSR